MPSPFFGIDIASQALRTFQRELDVTGNNIANVNTPGYSRQTANLTPGDGSVFVEGRTIALGDGVSVSSVNRIQDMFLQARRLSVSSDLGSSQALSTALGNVQPIILDSADSGVGDALTKFFDSWSALAGNPSDTGLKLQVQQAGENLAGQIRGGYLQLQDQKGEQTSQITQTLNDIQSKANAIADLNKQIVHAKALGAEPNDLEDQRDQAIQDLSGLVDIHTSEQSNGAIAVTLGQMTLVDGDGARQVPTQWDASKSQLTGGQVPVDVKSGKLAGLFAALNKTTSYQGQFDDLANSLRTQVNNLYQGAKSQAGVAGQNFFKDVPVTNPATPQTGAIDFDVEDSIKQDSTSIAAGPSGNASDGAIALQLSQLRQVSIASLNSRTFGQYFSDVATKIGSDVANAQSATSTNTAVVQQVDSQIQSISGVSLDDEMANMLRFQRSYQAAAKMLSMFDQTTEDLLGILH